VVGGLLGKEHLRDNIVVDGVYCGLGYHLVLM